MAVWRGGIRGRRVTMRSLAAALYRSARCTSVVRRSILVESGWRVKSAFRRLWYVRERRSLRLSARIDAVPVAPRHLQYLRSRQGIRVDDPRDPVLRGRRIAGAATQR